MSKKNEEKSNHKKIILLAIFFCISITITIFQEYFEEFADYEWRARAFLWVISALIFFEIIRNVRGCLRKKNNS